MTILYHLTLSFIAFAADFALHELSYNNNDNNNFIFRGFRTTTKTQRARGTETLTATPYNKRYNTF